MTQSAYIHIPFCKKKCNYCSFVSFVNQNDSAGEKYVKTVIDEIEHFYKDEPLETLYFGGGTPSLLKTSDIKNIIECFNYEKDPEITLEINPETVDALYLERLKNIGVNRLSIGVQSFDDKILKSTGRLHTAKKAAQTVIEAQKAGFKNISVDFIYGLPDQSLNNFINSLKTAVELDVKHISLYGLKIEKGCNFYVSEPENLADDDLQADMYIAAIEYLKAQGFFHYEISNFSHKGFESKHNLVYWSDKEYYGFGAAAHGYIAGVRYSNYAALNEFEKKYQEKEYLQSLNKQERLEECIFLGFRRGSGIDTKEINKKFNIDFEKFYANILNKYTESKHLVKTEHGYRFTPDGFLVSNVILAEFIEC